MFLSSCVEPLVTHGHSLPHWQWIQSVMHSILSNCHHVKTPMWKIKYKFVNYDNSSPFFFHDAMISTCEIIRCADAQTV